VIVARFTSKVMRMLADQTAGSVTLLALTLGACASGVTNNDSSNDAPKCTATPTQLIAISDLTRPDTTNPQTTSAAMDLAVSANDVYVAVNYGETGALFRLPIHGGASTLITHINGTEQGLLIAGDSVVMSQMRRVDGDALTTGEVVKIPLQGGDPVALATGRITEGNVLANNGTLASDGHDVYFATYDGAKSVPLAGGDVRNLSTEVGSLAILGERLVIADAAAHTLVSLPLMAADAAMTLASGLPQLLGPVAACGDDVCFAAGDPGTSVACGCGSLAIDKLDSTGAITHLWQSSASAEGVYRLLSSDAELYGSTMGDASFGGAFKLSTNGGELVELGEATGIAVDDECLYTASALTGVTSVAKR
jgi:hypothetical protein